MKEIREKTISDVLDTLDYDLDGIQTKGTRKASKDRAEAEIKKIFLDMVGEDKKYFGDKKISGERGWWEDNAGNVGHNQAKAEIRKKVEGELCG